MNSLDKLSGDVELLLLEFWVDLLLFNMSALYIGQEVAQSHTR